MKITIEHPKVFISYAWGSEDYRLKVRSFAKDLMSNGIDVLLDQWSLKEGNDTYAFMEQSATDSTITNVLIRFMRKRLMKELGELERKHRLFHQKSTIKLIRKNFCQ